MKKIMLVFGTRPEAIKMCPLALELKKRGSFGVTVAVTGQHREMLDSALGTFGVTPDFDLNVMKKNQGLPELTSEIMSGLVPVLDEVRPDVLLVHGDTVSALAAYLAAELKRVPVGHVEAGQRTYDLLSPYPEEFIRQTIDKTAGYCFCPTEKAARNLLSEGRDPSAVFITGNTVIDAMNYTLSRGFTHPLLEEAKKKRMILVTAHRRESLGERMDGMLRAIRRVLEEHPDCFGVFPVHMNPEVERAALAAFSDFPRMHLIPPLDASGFHCFEASCYLCLTDSGGLQEECPTFGKPVLVMRDHTERPEIIEAGTAILTGTSESGIYEAFTRLLDDGQAYSSMARTVNPYGDGHASERIADILEGKTPRPMHAENA